MQISSHAQNEPNPGLIFNTLNAHQQSAALRGAIELDLFTAIAKGHRTASSLAQQCQADARAMRILCDYLVVHGFLAKTIDEYHLTPTAAVFLDRDSPKYIGSIARFVNSPHLLDGFRDIAEIVRRGTTLLDDHGITETNYDGWVDFAQCMVPMIMPAATFIGKLAAERITGSVRVLDIAAGHGMFGISVAKHNPHASVVALDWEQVLNVARDNAEHAGIQDRYSLLPGDALNLDYGADYDLVLVTNFFHHFDIATCESVMRKIHGCLRNDGLVMTLEFVPNEDRVSPQVPAAFSFMMLGTTPSGDAYTFSQYDSMWSRAGLTSNELIDVPESEQRVILSQY